MLNDLQPRPFTQEEATAAAALFAFRAEFEGCWEAVCVCGFTSGMSLLEPTKDDAYYVACPACGRSGKDGGVKWVRVE
jgi:hypothetical protein